jgi:catalase
VLLFLLVGLLYIGATQTQRHPARWWQDASRLELHEEYPELHEEEEFRELAKKIQEIQKRLNPDSIQRGFHSKALGCLKGQFEVLEDRPDDARYGVFAEARTFPVWVRFSNASGSLQADNKSDMRGLAVKHW